MKHHLQRFNLESSIELSLILISSFQRLGLARLTGMMYNIMLLYIQVIEYVEEGS